MISRCQGRFQPYPSQEAITARVMKRVFWGTAGPFHGTTNLRSIPAPILLFMQGLMEGFFCFPYNGTDAWERELGKKDVIFDEYKREIYPNPSIS